MGSSSFLTSHFRVLLAWRFGGGPCTGKLLWWSFQLWTKFTLTFVLTVSGKTTSQLNCESKERMKYYLVHPHPGQTAPLPTVGTDETGRPGKGRWSSCEKGGLELCKCCLLPAGGALQHGVLVAKSHTHQGPGAARVRAHFIWPGISGPLRRTAHSGTAFSMRLVLWACGEGLKTSADG